MLTVAPLPDVTPDTVYGTLTTIGYVDGKPKHVPPAITGIVAWITPDPLAIGMITLP
jgi:hypothetical protein